VFNECDESGAVLKALTEAVLALFFFIWLENKSIKRRMGVASLTVEVNTSNDSHLLF
jgi:hypothetical protein